MEPNIILLDNPDLKTRFLTDDVFEWDNLISRSMVPFRSYLVALNGETVVGVVCFVQQTIKRADCLGLASVGVHPSYRNQGVATLLAHHLFQHAELHGIDVMNAHYEPMGEMYLKPAMRRAVMSYNVELID